MRDFWLYTMSEDDFEALIIDLCRDYLGIGTINFAKGRDGGRDGRFEGTAGKYPSAAAPWAGKFIIQAKHSTNCIASCSDSDFEANTTSVLSKELPRIKALRLKGEIDNYLIFTNRKLSGDADARICKLLRDETGVPNVAIHGKEYIHDFILPNWATLNLKYHFGHCREPLHIYPQDLKNLIAAFHTHALPTAASTFSPDFIVLDKKNTLNKLSEHYFTFIRTDSLPYFDAINQFLTAPINVALAAQYDNLVADFNNKILIQRSNFAQFDDLFGILVDAIVTAEPSLQQNMRLVITFLHYMYWQCDLGQKC